MSEGTTCRSCGKPIIWAKVKKRDGSIGSMPFDPDPTPDGTHQLFKRDYVTPEGAQRQLIRAEWVDKRARRSDSPPTLRKSHFATCPNADQHRRKK